MSTPFDFDREYKENDSIQKMEEGDKHERCQHCNSKLIFSHHHHLGQFQIIEASRCTGCGVTPEPQKFTLH